jgi:uncharacterized protein YhfF
MRFRPDLAELIRNGRKTEARFPIAKNLRGVHPAVKRAVQPGGEKAICHLWVTEVYTQPFEDIEHQDVLREGFHKLDGLLEWWKETYKTEPDWDDEVRVIRFELYKDQDKKPKGPRPLRDVNRTLRVPMDPGVPALDGFAQRKRAPEPGRVSEIEEERFVAENEMRWKAAHGDLHAKRELNRLGRSVREEGIRAIRRGVDVSAELTNIQRELDAIRDKRAA